MQIYKQNRKYTLGFSKNTQGEAVLKWGFCPSQDFTLLEKVWLSFPEGNGAYWTAGARSCPQSLSKKASGIWGAGQPRQGLGELLGRWDPLQLKIKEVVSVSGEPQQYGTWAPNKMAKLLETQVLNVWLEQSTSDAPCNRNANKIPRARRAKHSTSNQKEDSLNATSLPNNFYWESLASCSV